MDLSDAELPLDSQEELDYNNRRLKQAIDYMAAEGGGDTPDVYIDRINHMDEMLLQQLPQASAHFDRKLYKRVQAMIRATQREYEDALGYISQLGGHDVDDVSIDEEDLTELYTPGAAQALYRGEASPDEPPPPGLRRVGHKGHLELERNYLYGGEGNKAEKWYFNAINTLPFPDTFAMAQWESIMINHDLDDQVKQLKAEGKLVENNVPFRIRILDKYKCTDGLESSSRYTLPESDVGNEETIRSNIDGHIIRLLDEYNMRSPGSDDEKDIYKYVPRVALRVITPNLPRM